MEFDILQKGFLLLSSQLSMEAILNTHYDLHLNKKVNLQAI